MLLVGKNAQKYGFFFKRARKKGGFETLPYERGYYRLPDDGHIDSLLAFGPGANFELDGLTLVE